MGDLEIKKSLKIEDEYPSVNRQRLHSGLVRAFTKASIPTRFQIPFISDPNFRPQKKGLATYHLGQIDCIKFCFHAKTCKIYGLRKKDGIHIGCWNFESATLNLQICEKCHSVRYVEHPKKMKGICQRCRGQSEGIDNPDPKFANNPQAIATYNAMRQKRLKELKYE